MLTLKQINILKDNGFIDYEIGLLNKAKDPAGNTQIIDLGSREWRIAIQNRAQWARDQKKGGMSRKDYETMVKKFISGAKDEGGMFIFLREQYGRIKIAKNDYEEARGNRARKLVKKLYRKLKK
jgi:hypothetical protein